MKSRNRVLSRTGPQESMKHGYKLVISLEEENLRTVISNTSIYNGYQRSALPQLRGDWLMVKDSSTKIT